jgi:Fungal specific transcription factor domain
MAHLIFAIGLHRKRRLDSGTDLIVHECRKRVFWCAYTLDKYISAALGRPQTFHDEDVDQELPACVNDVDLRMSGSTPSSSRAQSIMLAPIAHIK